VVASAFGVHSDRCLLRRVRTVETLLVVGSSTPFLRRCGHRSRFYAPFGLELWNL
jgi:hypothetical protein